MKTDILLAMVVALLALYSSFGNDGAWYRDAMSVEVVPPYVAAYDALQNKIIAPLLDADIEELNNETVGAALVNDLVRQISCGVRTMRENLTEALNDSQTISKKLNDEIASLTLSISRTESEISQTGNTIATLSTQVGQTETQVRSAEQAVNDKQGEVNQAAAQQAEAQRAVDRARECRGKRSFRLRRIVRVVRFLCLSISTANIDLFFRLCDPSVVCSIPEVSIARKTVELWPRDHWRMLETVCRIFNNT